MTLPRFVRLCAYWAKHPPVHLLAAAALGVPAQQQKADLGELLAQFKSAGGAIR